MPLVDGVAVARYARSRAGLPVFLVTDYPHLMVCIAEPIEPAPIAFTEPLDYESFAEELGRAVGQ